MSLGSRVRRAGRALGIGTCASWLVGCLWRRSSHDLTVTNSTPPIMLASTHAPKIANATSGIIAPNPGQRSTFFAIHN
jgi:hypothetical protein